MQKVKNRRNTFATSFTQLHQEYELLCKVQVKQQNTVQCFYRLFIRSCPVTKVKYVCWPEICFKLTQPKSFPLRRSQRVCPRVCVCVTALTVALYCACACVWKVLSFPLESWLWIYIYTYATVWPTNFSCPSQFKWPENYFCLQLMNEYGQNNNTKIRSRFWPKQLKARQQ